MNHSHSRRDCQRGTPNRPTEGRATRRLDEMTWVEIRAEVERTAQVSRMSEAGLGRSIAERAAKYEDQKLARKLAEKWMEVR